MAKKDTYLALLRRGIDEKTAQILSDGGIKVGDLKTLDVETLTNNYGLKKEIATSVLDSVKSGPRSSAKQRYLADVLSDTGGKKKVDKIEYLEQVITAENQNPLDSMPVAVDSDETAVNTALS